MEDRATCRTLHVGAGSHRRGGGDGPVEDEGEELAMSDMLQMALFVLGWFVLQNWVFPRLGLRT
jgi:hypothetical protein